MSRLPAAKREVGPSWLREAAGAVVAVAVLGAAGRAAAQVVQNPPTPYHFLRYDDTPADQQSPYWPDDYTAPLKFIPLDLAPHSYINFGGEDRERVEYYNNPFFGLQPPPGNAVYDLHRLLLEGDLHIGDTFRTFIQFGNHLATSHSTSPPTDIDRLDLQQGFADLSVPVGEDGRFTVRGGRQEITFGSARLVDVREGPNVRLSFDGIRTFYESPDLRVDAFATKPVVVQEGVFDDYSDPDQSFWGVYGVMPVRAVPGLNVDAYYLGLSSENATYSSGTANELRHSVGTRLWGGRGNWDYNTEGVLQFGSFGSRDIRAWTLASNTGYTIPSSWGPLRFGLQADIASGGGASGALKSFNPLFPKFAWFTEASINAPINMIDAFPSITVQPRRDFAVTAGVDFLWRYSTQDGFYQPPGVPLVSGTANDKRYLGEQYNLHAEWQATPHLDLNAVYVHFQAEGFLSAAGAKNIDFLGFWTSYKF